MEGWRKKVGREGRGRREKNGRRKEEGEERKEKGEEVEWTMESAQRKSTILSKYTTITCIVKDISLNFSFFLQIDLSFIYRK